MSNDGVLGLPAYSDREALANFLEGLKVSESAAKQLAFYTGDPAWLKVRLALEATRTISTSLALSSIAKRMRQ